MPRGPSTRQASKKRKTRPEPESEPETEIEVKNSPEPEESSDSGESKLSPWDPTERKVLDVDSLDLDTSYLQVFPRSNALYACIRRETFPENRKKRQRWTNKKKKAIQKIEDLPEGWHATEPDLDQRSVQPASCRRYPLLLVYASTYYLVSAISMLKFIDVMKESRTTSFLSFLRRSLRIWKPPRHSTSKCFPK